MKNFPVNHIKGGTYYNFFKKRNLICLRRYRFFLLIWVFLYAGISIAQEQTFTSPPPADQKSKKAKPIIQIPNSKPSTYNYAPDFQNNSTLAISFENQQMIGMAFIHKGNSKTGTSYPLYGAKEYFLPGINTENSKEVFLVVYGASKGGKVELKTIQENIIKDNLSYTLAPYETFYGDLESWRIGERKSSSSLCGSLELISVVAPQAISAKNFYGLIILQRLDNGMLYTYPYSKENDLSDTISAPFWKIEPDLWETKIALFNNDDVELNFGIRLRDPDGFIVREFSNNLLPPKSSKILNLSDFLNNSKELEYSTYQKNWHYGALKIYFPSLPKEDLRNNHLSAQIIQYNQGYGTGGSWSLFYDPEENCLISPFWMSFTPATDSLLYIANNSPAEAKINLSVLEESANSIIHQGSFVLSADSSLTIPISDFILNPNGYPAYYGTEVTKGSLTMQWQDSPICALVEAYNFSNFSIFNIPGILSPKGNSGTMEFPFWIDWDKKWDTRITFFNSGDNIGSGFVKLFNQLGSFQGIRKITLKPGQTKEIWASQIGPPVHEEILIPAGNFLMGRPEGYGKRDETPQHQIYLDAYYIDKYEVTNAEYAEFIKDNGYYRQELWSSKGWAWRISGQVEVPFCWGNNQWHCDSKWPFHPQTGVSWYEAEAYCCWQGKRLPSEAEWEKAARGPEPNSPTYAWGNNLDCWHTNYNSRQKLCVGSTARVGSYKAGVSHYKAYDMTGNLWEWTNDFYQSNYYLFSPRNNPPGADSGQYKVFRGGCWTCNHYGADMGLTLRKTSPPTFRNYTVGFRCVRPLKKNDSNLTDQKELEPLRRKSSKH